jgi:hypothetical protein
VIPAAVLAQLLDLRSAPAGALAACLSGWDLDQAGKSSARLQCKKLLWMNPSLPPDGAFGFPDALRLPQRLELEIDPDLYERVEKLSIRSGRSIPEIIQGLICSAFPINPAETVLGESIS